MDGDVPMRRVEAAAYLTSKGMSMSPAKLARIATDGGPTFTMEAHRAFYKRDDLDAWLATATASKGGKKVRRTKGTAISDLIDSLEEFLPMVERVMTGSGTFQDGVRFGQTLDRVKRAMRKKRNGAAH